MEPISHLDDLFNCDFPDTNSCHNVACCSQRSNSFWMESFLLHNQDGSCQTGAPLDSGLSFRLGDNSHALALCLYTAQESLPQPVEEQGPTTQLFSAKWREKGCHCQGKVSKKAGFTFYACSRRCSEARLSWQEPSFKTCIKFWSYFLLYFPHFWYRILCRNILKTSVLKWLQRLNYWKSKIKLKKN